MAKYAIIENNVVVNCIEADEAFINKSLNDGLFNEAILINELPINIGDLKQSDGSFLPPSVEENGE